MSTEIDELKQARYRSGKTISGHNAFLRPPTGETNSVDTRGFYFVLKEPHPKAFEYYRALEKIHTYIRQQPDTSLTLTEAAAIAGMEATHFSKFFHKKTGVCFKYWEDLRKVERAIALFEATDISVTEAALKAGFNDLTT